MRKILYLITIILTLTFGLSAQATDFQQVLNDLQSGGSVMDIDLSSFVDTTTLNDATVQDDIRTTLQQEGFDETTINQTLAAANTIATDGSINTLQQLKDSNPTVYDQIENALVEVVTSRAIEELYASNPEVEENVRTLARALKTMSGFAQANAQTSTTSSLFGHQGYKLFAVSFGFVGSVATDDFSRDLGIITSSNPSKRIEEELKAGGLEAGVAMQGFTANVGINMSWLVDRLYLGVVFGTTNTTVTPEKTKSSVLGFDIINNTNTSTTNSDLNLHMSLSTATFGVTANYQLIKPFNIPILYRWNGISLGSGFIYNSFNIDAEGDLTSMLSSGTSNTSDPTTFKGSFSINSSSFTIPLEVSTGVRLLSALNLSVGAGVDLKFGGSSMEFDVDADGIDPLNVKMAKAFLDNALEKENLSFPYGNDGEVKLFNPRVMAGLGIGLGPVTLDVYANIYVLTGFTFGTNFVLRI